MNFQFYLEKLFASSVFTKFLKENPSAYPCSGFFVIDREKKEKPDDKVHFDYFIPETSKMFSFKLEDGCALIPVEVTDKRVPEKLGFNYDFDLNDVEKLIIEKMKQEKVGHKLQKILLSLQKLEGKDYLVGTVFISAMGMIKIEYDIAEEKITCFEKKSFFDMVNVFKKKESEEKK